MLLKLQKGDNIWTNETPFLRQDSSTRAVRSTMTTGVISSSSILPSSVVAGSTIFVLSSFLLYEIWLIRSLFALSMEGLNRQREREHGAVNARRLLLCVRENSVARFGINGPVMNRETSWTYLFGSLGLRPVKL